MKTRFVYLLCFVSMISWCVLTSCASAPKSGEQVEVDSADHLVKSESSWAIMQGATSATATEIVILHKVGEQLSVWAEEVPVKKEFSSPLSDSKKVTPKLPQNQTRHLRPNQEYALTHFYFEGLRSSTSYVLKVSGGDASKKDERYFRTLDTHKPELSFALVSCMDDSFKKEQEMMWSQLSSMRPDVIFLIGDNVYADWKESRNLGPVVDSSTMWQRFVETRQILSLFRQRRLTPVLAVWDDHDFGMNDGNRNRPNIGDAQEIFFSFFGRQDIGATEFAAGPGVSFTWETRGQVFAFLDDRSFRSVNKKPTICESRSNHSACQRGGTYASPDADETHFGEQQEEWLFRQLALRRSPVWLISGDQWFGGYQPFESYEGNHPRSFKRFLDRLLVQDDLFVFLSGDRHLSEMMRIEPAAVGYETYELTSSAIHARVFPPGWSDFPNPRQIEGRGETLNYTMITSRTDSPTKLLARITAWGPNNTILYSREINLAR